LLSTELMRNQLSKYGTWGMVAGAAQGLGAAFVENLAIQGKNVIMIDRNETELKQIAIKVEKKYSIKTHPLILDLSDLNNLDEITKILINLNCRLFIYNAAYGPVKPFMENTTEELDYYIDLNSRMPLHLISKFLQSRKNEKPAGIIIMSSLAGLWGTQLVVPYGATKAFDYNLAEGLYYELKSRKVDVLGCIAGAIDTPNYRSTQPKKNLIGPSIMKPDTVARKALSKLSKKPVYIPGFFNQFTYFLFTRIFPRSIATAMMNRTMDKMYN